MAIETKHLVEFVSYHTRIDTIQEGEWLHEIVARLERYDEMKEGIEKICRDLSNRVDTK